MEPNTKAQGEKNWSASYKELEEALQKSENKFRHLIHSNIVGVLFWDIDGGITDANEAFLNMLGYTRDELEKGLDWRTMTPPEWKAIDDEGARQLLTSGRHLPFEKQYLHKNGTPVEVIIASSAFEDTGNRQGVTFVLNISERKKAEQKIREARNCSAALATTLPAWPGSPVPMVGSGGTTSVGTITPALPWKKCRAGGGRKCITPTTWTG